MLTAISAGCVRQREMALSAQARVSTDVEAGPGHHQAHRGCVRQPAQVLRSGERHCGSAPGCQVPSGAALRHQGVASALLDRPKRKRGNERLCQGRCPRVTRRSNQKEDPRGSSPAPVRGPAPLRFQYPEDRCLPPTGNSHQGGIGQTAPPSAPDPVAPGLPSQRGHT
jgi:hypothetical protein